MVGAGKVASLIPEAMRTVRPLRLVRVWDLNLESAEALCVRLRAAGLEATPELDRQAGTEAADIISCATLSTNPLVEGAWLKPGQHLDLIGSFTPKMRETDDEAMRVADVYVDTETAFLESGDLVYPLESGAITKAAVRGNLTTLSRGEVSGRTSADSITLYKAVGTALEDLAAASLAYDRSKTRSVART